MNTGSNQNEKAKHTINPLPTHRLQGERCALGDHYNRPGIMQCISSRPSSIMPCGCLERPQRNRSRHPGSGLRREMC